MPSHDDSPSTTTYGWPSGPKHLHPATCDDLRTKPSAKSRFVFISQYITGFSLVGSSVYFMCSLCSLYFCIQISALFHVCQTLSAPSQTCKVTRWWNPTLLLKKKPFQCLSSRSAGFLPRARVLSRGVSESSARYLGCSNGCTPLDCDLRSRSFNLPETDSQLGSHSPQCSCTTGTIRFPFHIHLLLPAVVDISRASHDLSSWCCSGSFNRCLPMTKTGYVVWNLKSHGF